jgi:mRNA-degrading endonuclease toxin of MazEF toxin-antitoxin module
LRLSQGDVIWGWFADPQGHNKKLRPAVVVTADQDIDADDEVEVVVISTKLAKAPAEESVLIPNHPRTGLPAKSAAVCTWLASIPKSDIDRVSGSLLSALVDRILDKLDELAE